MRKNLTRTQLRAGIAAAAIVVAAAVYWTSRPEQTVAPVEVRLGAPSLQGLSADARRQQPQPAQTQTASARARAAAAPIDSEESTIAQYVAEKYQFLLEDLGYLQASQLGQLKQTLLMRDRLDGEMKAARQSNDAAAIENLPRQEQALAQAEGEIRGILNPTDYATYEALKDSDLEQFQLNDYAGGISNVAPLSAADRKAILKTKLAYKGRFRQLVRDSGLLRANLSPTEREYAYSMTSRALDDYKRSYLQEVRQYLASEDQYVLLSNYETTEFTAELAKLRSSADGLEQQ